MTGPGRGRANHGAGMVWTQTGVPLILSPTDDDLNFIEKMASFDAWEAPTQPSGLTTESG